MTTIAEIDEAATRLRMSIIEIDARTWRGFVDTAKTVQRDLDGARSLIARAEVSMRERANQHDQTKKRAVELADQIALLTEALNIVLRTNATAVDRSYAANILRSVQDASRQQGSPGR